MILFTLNLQTPKTSLRKGLLAVDWLGTLLLVGSVLMFLLGLEFGGVSHPWNPSIVICLIVFGLVTMVPFFLVQWKVARYPVMPLKIFTSWTNVASLLACFFHGLVFIAGPFYLPMYFQSVLGATPLLSGVWFMPFALAMAFAGAVTGIYIEKTGRYKECITLGFAIQTLGTGLLYNLPSTPEWGKIIVYLILAGFGGSPNFQSPLVALQIHTQQEDNATTTATFNTVRNLATAIGVVLGSTIFSNEMSKQSAALIASLGSEDGHLLSGGAALANVFTVHGLQGPSRVVAERAYFLSIRKIWILYTVLGGLGLIVSFFVSRKVLETQQQEVELGLDTEERKRKLRKGQKPGIDPEA